jgi:signal transduction histidine kinase
MALIQKKIISEKVIRNIYIMSFVLLFIAYLITLYSKKQLENQAVRVELTSNRINNLNNLQIKIMDGETGVRGYIMNKDIRFLFPYYGSQASADSIYNIILQLTSDSPIQKERLLQLKEYVDRRFEQMRLNIKLFNDNNREMSDSMRTIQQDTKKTMDEIRSIIAIMERHENKELSAWKDRMKQTFKSIDTFTIISPVLAFILLFFGLITYMRLSKSREIAQQEVIQYQNQLKSRVDELAEANKELIKMRSIEKFAATGRIARTIAHEVRNPLTNINLAVDQLKSEVVVQEDETSTMLFTMIKRNSDRINQLISDLLNSTKFSELAYEKVSINQLLDEALEEAEDRITLTNVEVVKKYSKDFCDVDVDRAKIKIAFLNLIINALEAMENKAGSVLTLETKIELNRCKVVIKDNGTGLDKESANRLFEPYFTNKPNGNGLGLTNTQNIILNHKGEIAFETTQGKGTSFTILLDL